MQTDDDSFCRGVYTHWRVDPSRWHSRGLCGAGRRPRLGGRRAWWCLRRWRRKTAWSGQCRCCKHLGGRMKNMVYAVLMFCYIDFIFCSWGNTELCGAAVAVTGWAGCCSPHERWLQLASGRPSPPRSSSGCVYPAPLCSCSGHCGVADDMVLGGDWTVALTLLPVCTTLLLRWWWLEDA